MCSSSKIQVKLACELEKNHNLETQNPGQRPDWGKKNKTKNNYFQRLDTDAGRTQGLTDWTDP